MTSECTEQIVNKDALLATAKEEHAKLIQVMQLEVNEYKVCHSLCACACGLICHCSDCTVNVIFSM